MINTLGHTRKIKDETTGHIISITDTVVHIVPAVEKVIYNNPATIVFWNDGTKTVVKCQKEDTFSKSAGLYAAISKKMLGKKEFYRAIKEFC